MTKNGSSFYLVVYTFIFAIINNGLLESRRRAHRTIRMLLTIRGSILHQVNFVLLQKIHIISHKHHPLNNNLHHHRSICLQISNGKEIMAVVVTSLHVCLTYWYILSDEANICFCLYNQTYWLYAIEAYFFNLYYLFIVSYVCQSYLLKVRRKNKEPVSNGTLVERKLSNDDTDNGKTLFYGIFIALLTLYSAIFLFSMIREVRDTNDRDSQKNRNYCQCN